MHIFYLISFGCYHVGIGFCNKATNLKNEEYEDETSQMNATNATLQGEKGEDWGQN